MFESEFEIDKSFKGLTLACLSQRLEIEKLHKFKDHAQETRFGLNVEIFQDVREITSTFTWVICVTTTPLTPPADNSGYNRTEIKMKYLKQICDYDNHTVIMLIGIA